MTHNLQLHHQQPKQSRMRTLLGVKDNKSSATARWGNDRGTIKQRTDLIFATSRMAGGEVRPQTALMSVEDNSFEGRSVVGGVGNGYGDKRLRG